MGYSTSFYGRIEIEPPLTQEERAFLEGLGELAPRQTPGLPREMAGSPPDSWCGWTPTSDGTALVWNEQEKFREPEKWMTWVVELLSPHGRSKHASQSGCEALTFGHSCHGKLAAVGEELFDYWILHVREGVVEREDIPRLGPFEVDLDEPGPCRLNDTLGRPGRAREESVEETVAATEFGDPMHFIQALRRLAPALPDGEQFGHFLDRMDLPGPTPALLRASEPDRSAGHEETDPELATAIDSGADPEVPPAAPVDVAAALESMAHHLPPSSLEPNATCRTCQDFVRSPIASEASELDGSAWSCTVRQHAMAQPDATFCANHTHFAPRVRTPIGPTLRRSGEQLDVVDPSKDNRTIRDGLLLTLEHVDASLVSQLSFSERVAIWQVRQFGERQAFVHLDRLELQLTPPSTRTNNAVERLTDRVGEAVIGDSIDVVADALRTAQKPDGFVDRFTLAGRLLLLSSFFVTAVSFWVAWAIAEAAGLSLLDSPRTNKLVLVVFGGFLGGVVYLRAGLFVLRKFRLPFRVDESSETQRRT